jgi:hypothetical protein
MCVSCWQDHGSPAIINDDVIKAANLVKAIYEYNLVGSNCHVVVDDWNLQSEHIEECLKSLPNNLHKVSDSQLAGEKECLLSLQNLSLPERYSALAIGEGLIRIQP